MPTKPTPKPTPESLQQLARDLIKQRIPLAEKEVGEYRITQKHHEAGSKITLVSLREAMFAGLPVTDLELEEDLTVNWLEGPEGSWMSDQPCELIQMHQELACHARGRVLIGGLGLGVVARMVSLMGKVTKIVVVENSPEIIALMGDSLTDPKIEIVQADLHEYVKHLRWNQFNTALLDIWQGTGEWAWQTQVVPLRRAIGGTIRKIYCWQESTMINQVAQGLFYACELPAEEICEYSHCHWYAFRKACIDFGFKSATPGVVIPGENEPNTPELVSKQMSLRVQLENENRKNDMLRQFMQSFMYVGSSAWERAFGKYWDEAWSHQNESEASA